MSIRPPRRFFSSPHTLTTEHSNNHKPASIQSLKIEMGQSTMIATIFGAILSTAVLTQAAPLTVRQSGSYYSNSTTVTNTTTSTSGSPPSTYTGAPFGSGPYTGYPSSGIAPIAQVFPEYTSQYNSRTGAVDFNTERGLVSRSPTNGGADITTLVTFALDEQYASNWCQLVFDLENASSSASGSKQAQLFTSLAPATTDTTTWPSGNQRNQALGSIQIIPGGEAQWQLGTGPGATSNGFFPCGLIAGQVYGGEVVPQGDSVEVSWPAGQDGVKIVVY
ncbi:hypothetical protein LTS06_004983 [Exophiala xenobiotica]|nr:hypothetical protein LTS06_004983 [Exophiala xenobiotica]